ncbi:hypothetical protein J5N97_000678 [Dioscorea zingiberensis]|uniref:Uncharacterized protein n=1 Tax=Dioscorea zingiberensis TaxID=325984 RepID=A0A9D5BS90_9LILI|nr:hypothetical protein J5N97_000678 [Dioscorea zingiberensis]
MVIALAYCGCISWSSDRSHCARPSWKNPAAIAAACGHKEILLKLLHRIQSAFRGSLFLWKRQQKAALSQDEYGMTQEEIHSLSAASKFHKTFHSARDQNFDKAALSIQKKYRGWKGRKDFLNLRQNVVKIQAYVRGHQVRKKYKKVLWTVSIVEKAILCWRGKVLV